MTEFKEAEFLEYIGLTHEELEVAAIDVDELIHIYNHHEDRQSHLSRVGDAIQGSLSRMPRVHSTRVRIKSPRSLVRKVVRKRTAQPERDISANTYTEEIRDLIGLRALHLFKEDWELIHGEIIDFWQLHPLEVPLAYLREGDREDLEKSLESAGFKVQKKSGGYRSLHYIIQSQIGRRPDYAEIQVRTLFEEAWGEVDHQVRYPDNLDDELLSDYLLILNRLAGGADEMSSLLLRYKAVFEQHRLLAESMQQRHEAQLAKIKKVEADNALWVAKLQVSEATKAELLQRLEEKTERESVDEIRDFQVLKGADLMTTLRAASYSPGEWENSVSSTIGLLLARMREDNSIPVGGAVDFLLRDAAAKAIVDEEQKRRLQPPVPKPRPKPKRAEG